jgi:hypothetical protein
MKYFFISFLFSTSIFSQINVCFEIEDNANQDLFALQVFTKYVNVLDCIHIYAEESVSDSKVLHAAAIAAELLDNDEDGVIDDINVQETLLTKQTIMPLFAYEGSNAEELLFDNFDLLVEEYNYCAGAVLYNNEIDPNNPGFWGNDASVEEILHTINACSHVEIYPYFFGLEPNSSQMSDAMDIARGGQFLSIPNNYPEEAWYHYDDWTCDYECMAMEYLYWCIVTNMELLDNNMICNGISDEWELCSQDDFQNTDVLMYNIITNPDLKIPQLAPDGNYCPEQSNINEGNLIEKKYIQSFDVLGRVVDSSKKGILIDLYNNGFVKKKINY